MGILLTPIEGIACNRLEDYRIIGIRPRLTCWQTWSDSDSSPTVPLILQENPLKYHRKKGT